MDYRGLTLDPFQIEAIEQIEKGHSVIVSAPTGTGKTLIADYLIEHILEQGGEVIYTSPIKALSNQKYRQYSALFGPEKVGLVTGDLVIRRDAPLRIMTTEILRNILLEGRHDLDLVESDTDEERTSPASPAETDIPDLRKLRAVIIDEIHFLDDPDRGTVWEEMLIYLPHDIRILGLSATLSNLEEFAQWLGMVRDTEMKIVYEPRRTVPLQFFMVNNDVGRLPIDTFNKKYAGWRRGGGRGRSRGRDRGRGRSGRTTRHVEVIESLHDQSFPALYFIFSRALVERLAQDLARTRTGRELVDNAFKRKVETHLARFEKEFPGVLKDKLGQMYRKGIAFHHAGLHVALKGLVEELYEAGLVRILYCTSTFALGINMPARTVIFDGLTKYDGTAINPLTVREFMQMAGRAGRRGIDTEGDIVIRQDFHDYDEVQPLIARLLEGESEPVNSSFNLSFHAVVNLIARFSEENIRALLSQSFKAWRSRQMADALRGDIERRQDVLEGDDAIDHEADEDISLKQAKRRRKHRRRLTALRRRLVEEERPRLWEEFHRKLEFLRSHGYISVDNDLLASATILRQIKMEEIFLTELIVNGVLDPLDPDQIFGVMCALIQTLPRTAKVTWGGGEWREITTSIYEVYQSEVVQGAAALTNQEVVFTPELMPLGERWAKGESLSALMEDIHNPTDLSGDIVGALRRAKDLVSQLRSVHSEDAAMRKNLGALMRRVTRDEVEAIR